MKKLSILILGLLLSFTSARADVLSEAEAIAQRAAERAGNVATRIAGANGISEKVARAASASRALTSRAYAALGRAATTFATEAGAAAEATGVSAAITEIGTVASSISGGFLIFMPKELLEQGPPQAVNDLPSKGLGAPAAPPAGLVQEHSASRGA